MMTGTLRRLFLVGLVLGACRQDQSKQAVQETGGATTSTTDTGGQSVEEHNVHLTFVVDDAPLAGIEHAIVTLDGQPLPPIGSDGALAFDASAGEHDLAVLLPRTFAGRAQLLVPDSGMVVYVVLHDRRDVSPPPPVADGSSAPFEP